MEFRPTQRLVVNGVEIDLDAEVLRDEAGAPIRLRPQAFAVLGHLIANAGRVVTKDELTAAVWRDVAVTDDSLVQCVSDIRRALHDDARRVLQTAVRRGYRLVLPAPASDRRRDARLRWWVPAGAAAALAVALGMAPWDRPPAAPAEPSVAVLPFDDLGGDARQQRFAAAFTEDLITDLARTKSVRVVARTSTEAVARRAADVRDIAAELGVGYLLEGSLDMPPNRIRVTAQLIDAGSGLHVWSERYDRPAADLFAVRDEILTRLVGTLTGYDNPLVRAWIAAAKRRPPESLGAYDLFLMATEPYSRHDREGVAEAGALLNRAVALDPTLARAWDFLAHVHMQQAINGWGDQADAWERTRDATRRAAALDPADGHIQMSLGVMHFQQGDIAAGTAAWDRALELAPNDALVNRAIGTQLAIALGIERADEGVRLVRRALEELDPLHPPFQWLSLGYALYFAGRYHEAVEALRKVSDPWMEPRLILALALAQAGEIGAAQEEAAEVLRLNPGFSAEAWIANDFYQPAGSSARRFAEGAREAGLPVCAADAAALPQARRLPECEALRTLAAAAVPTR